MEVATNRDAPNVRIVEVDRNKLLVKREDPYGFWYINYERGVTPAVLKGAYTSAEGAMSAIEAYLRSKDKEGKEVKEK